jgi:D-alanyl-D-alanine carboxypeptidase/D-alanyl-D-alanine-endopeptidase (penicillin-binding protein 4)
VYPYVTAPAAGAVVAVSGSLDGVRSLAGVVTAADGTVLSFAFVASGGAVADGTETALDTLAATVQTCGNNLSNL